MCTYNIAIDDRDSIELPSNKIWESKGFVERERERDRERERLEGTVSWRQWIQQPLGNILRYTLKS